MFKQKNLLPFLALAALFVAFIIFSPLIVNKIFAQSTPTGPLSGWAWSSNIGWICFGNPNNNCPGANVTLNPDGTFTGSAWSSNIGWIKFNGLGTGPDGQGSANLFGASSIVGWARACSVFASGCTGTLKDDIYRGGWDGWLKFGGGTMTSGWPGVSLVGKQLTGFAWGSEVLGWVKFDGVTIGDGFSAQCLINPPNPIVNDEIDFAIVTSGGTSPYNYTWQIDGPGNEDFRGFKNDVNGPNSGTFNLHDWQTNPYFYNLAGTYTLSAQVTDSNANNGNASCNTTFTVTDGTQPQLTVNVVGSGSVNSSPSGINNCGTSCVAGFNNGSTVTLTATPPVGGKFESWEGCTPVSGTPTRCTVLMDSNKTVTARFSPLKKFKLEVSYPNGRNMVVNYQTQNLDIQHESTRAKVKLTDLDDDTTNNPTNITFTLVKTSLNNRCSVVAKRPDLKTSGSITVGSSPEIYLQFPDDCQDKPNTASPYAGNYSLSLQANPGDGSQVDPVPVNFSYIDLREREQ